MKKSGFSLIEISIVVVVIGIMVVGVMAGKTFSNSAKLNNIMTDLSVYKGAYDEFVNHYSAVPGDMINAKDTFQMGNDGDGDSIIESENTEHLYAWQQLSLANLITGKYNGTDQTSEIISGTNIPEGPVKGGVYNMIYYAITSEAAYISHQYKFNNSLVFAAININNNTPSSGILTPEQVYTIDNKIDDGKPDTGIISVNRDLTGLDESGGVNECISGSDYNMTYTDSACTLIYALTRMQSGS